MRILLYLILKMWQNRWFTFSTLLGLTVAAAFAMSIPMYADGTLKRLVEKSLQEETKGLPASSLYMNYQGESGEETDLESLAEADGWISGELPGQIGFPVDAYSSRMALMPSTVRRAEESSAGTSRLMRMELASQQGIEDLIEPTAGRMPADGFKNGDVEAAVLSETMSRNGWKLGDSFIYNAKDGDGKTKRLTVRIVGVYKLKDETDLRLAVDGKDKLAETLLVSRGTMTDALLGEKKLALGTAGWYYAFDLRSIRIGDLPLLIGELERLDVNLHRMLEGAKVNLSFVDMLHDFNRQSILLQAMLFALAAPVLAMVLYYVTMSAKQSLDRQRGDISVLHSRGASPRQITALYAIEALLLGTMALLIGVGIAWFLAAMIGSSSGFLSFVGRKAIPVGTNNAVWLFGGIATFLAVIATVAPIRHYADASIIAYTQQKARADKPPFWQRFYVDVALLLAAVTGWYMLRSGQISTVVPGGDDAQIQPYLFVIPALFLFAAGLLCLRVFPMLLRLWHIVANRRVPVTVYLTLTQLARSAATFYPLMILLILTIGLGVYNASAARTIDVNAEDRTTYRYGGEVTLQAAWEGVQDEDDQNRIYYDEPSFQAYSNLPGVESATRVLKGMGKANVGGRSAGNVQVMGIDNVGFAQTAFFREDMYPVHPYYYLDALGMAEQAVLVSASFAEKHSLKEGDPVRLSIGYGNEPVDLVVVGIVPYWPSMYGDGTPFFIANLDYLYQQIEKIPYEVWLSMEDGAKLAPALNELADRGVAIVKAEDARTELAKLRSHPAHGGVSGILSLGFLLSLLVSLLGYLIFWFFTLSRRVVQLGILRAMGLSRGQLAAMLMLEQLFTTGLSVVIGIMLGKAASRLFLPFLQSGGAEQIPPFRVVFEAEDMQKLYVATGAMLAAGVILLLVQLRRLKVSQAVKLGEER